MYADSADQSEAIGDKKGTAPLPHFDRVLQELQRSSTLFAAYAILAVHQVNNGIVRMVPRAMLPDYRSPIESNWECNQ